jgi:hypothetical protein
MRFFEILGQGPAQILGYWPWPLASGWVIWDPVSWPGYFAPGIWASWVRYLAPAPGPQHLYGEVFVTKFSRYLSPNFPNLLHLTYVAKIQTLPFQTQVAYLFIQKISEVPTPVSYLERL